MFFLGALRDASAGRLTAVIPHLCYGRKDRRTTPRDSVTTRYLAEMLESVGVDRVVAIDAHNPAAFDNAFRCRTDHLGAVGLFVQHFADLARREPVTVMSPDVGGIKRAELFREALASAADAEIPGAFMEKRRSRGVVSGDAVVGSVEGRTAIILDDLISSGTTLRRTAAACRDRGAATHGLFTGNAGDAIGDPTLDEVAITDTIPPFRLDPELVRRKVSVLDATGLIAEAIHRIHTGGSIVGLSAG